MSWTPISGPDEVAGQAAEFFALPEIAEIAAPQRRREVQAEIADTGTYRQTENELLIGAKLAWRNHARCAGRYSWRSLRLLDMRDQRTPDEIAEGCFEHLRVSTNGGRLRSVITVFEQEKPGHSGPRLHNPQLIRYAGYQTSDGVVGDPLHVDLTADVTGRGWVGKGTAFDVLPLLVSVDGSEPLMYEVPDSAVLEVLLEHPEFSWFADLGLRWHANPAISNLCLDIGGVRYPASPFSGWYVSSEIGARNLSDEARYNMLPAIAHGMGLSTRRNASLWKDRALIELNRAVLWSYEKAGVYIVDHHTAAAQFLTHVDRETECGRPVPADWAWVNPPLSASTTPTYHRTFDAPDFSIRPNFYANPPIPASAEARLEATMNLHADAGTTLPPGAVSEAVSEPASDTAPVPASDMASETASDVASAPVVVRPEPLLETAGCPWPGHSATIASQ